MDVPTAMDVSTELKLFENPWKIIKRLERSDIDGSCRLLLGKISVQTHVKPIMDRARARGIETSEGARVTIWDLDTNSEHELTIKRWSTGSYVLNNNWKREFVNRLNLRQGDEIGLFWNQDKSIFYFRVLNRNPVN